MWLSEIKNEIKTSKIPKIIIANKYDLVESGQRERAVSEKELVDFCVEHGLDFRETSAVTGHNVRETFSEFIQCRRASIQRSSTTPLATSRRSRAARNCTLIASPWRGRSPRAQKPNHPTAPNAADFSLKL